MKTYTEHGLMMSAFNFCVTQKYLRFYLAVTKRLLIFATVKTENNVLKQGQDDIKPRTY